MNRKLRVIIITQEEHFFIPKNIKKASKEANILCIVNNTTKSSLGNRSIDFFKWFGFSQFFKMGTMVMWRRFKSIVDRMSSFNAFKGENSVKDMAGFLGVDFKEVSDINSEKFVEFVKDQDVDLIVSYSAPQVIKDQLLSLPQYGIINVHGSLLPDYRGVLPSFWYLYNNEKVGGATVHFMSKKIDDGDIILQREVDISDCNTMFELMTKTKKLGGELIVETIRKFHEGLTTSRINDTTNGRYFTWPTDEEARKFKRNGKRLV